MDGFDVRASTASNTNAAGGHGMVLSDRLQTSTSSQKIAQEGSGSSQAVQDEVAAVQGRIARVAAFLGTDQTGVAEGHTRIHTGQVVPNTFFQPIPQHPRRYETDKSRYIRACTLIPATRMLQSPITYEARQTFYTRQATQLKRQDMEQIASEYTLWLSILRMPAGCRTTPSEIKTGSTGLAVPRNGRRRSRENGGSRRLPSTPA